MIEFLLLLYQLLPSSLSEENPVDEGGERDPLLNCYRGGWTGSEATGRWERCHERRSLLQENKEEEQERERGVGTR